MSRNSTRHWRALRAPTPVGTAALAAAVAMLAASVVTYIVWFHGLSPGHIATEATTWGAPKVLYE